MINHTRSILNNAAVPAIYADTDEYIPTGFSPISLSPKLYSVWITLFGTTNQASKNSTLARLLTVADTDKTLQDAVLEFDSRVTYSSPYDVFDIEYHDWTELADNVDPSDVFSSDNDTDVALQKIWQNSPSTPHRACAAALALSRRINDLRLAAGLDQGLL